MAKSGKMVFAEDGRNVVYVGKAWDRYIDTWRAFEKSLAKERLVRLTYYKDKVLEYVKANMVIDPIRADLGYIVDIPMCPEHEELLAILNTMMLFKFAKIHIKPDIMTMAFSTDHAEEVETLILADMLRLNSSLCEDITYNIANKIPPHIEVCIEKHGRFREWLKSHFTASEAPLC